MSVSSRRTVKAAVCALALAVIGIVVVDCRSAIGALAPRIGYDPAEVHLLVVFGALLAFAAGQLLFLHAVADRLCPHASPTLRWTFKTLAFELCCVAVIGMGHQCWVLI